MYQPMVVISYLHDVEHIRMGSEQTDPLQPLTTYFYNCMGNGIIPCNLSELIG